MFVKIKKKKNKLNKNFIKINKNFVFINIKFYVRSYYRKKIVIFL